MLVVIGGGGGAPRRAALPRLSPWPRARANSACCFFARAANRIIALAAGSPITSPARAHTVGRIVHQNAFRCAQSRARPAQTSSNAPPAVGCARQSARPCAWARRGARLPPPFPPFPSTKTSPPFCARTDSWPLPLARLLAAPRRSVPRVRALPLASAAMASEAAGPPAVAKEVIIHVFDEGRSAQRDFECALDTLLNEMAYFAVHLGADAGASAAAAEVAGSGAASAKVEISVHCDLEVFSWLLDWALAPSRSQPRSRPALSNVIPVLISSEFLQMRALVADCVAFIAQNLREVAELPVDLCALSEAVLRAIARGAHVDAIEEVRAAATGNAKSDGPVAAKGSDSAAKPALSRHAHALVSKLYRFKLEDMLTTHARHDDAESETEGPDRVDELQAAPPRTGGGRSLLSCCSRCGEVFATAASSRLVCARSALCVDYHGNVVATHTPARGWTAHRYIKSLRAQRGCTWRDLYWHAWGLSRVLDCRVCGQAFAVAHMSRCAYHPLPASFVGASNTGVHACCGAPALRFDSAGPMRGSGAERGCCLREHRVDRAALERQLASARTALDEAETHAIEERLRNIPLSATAEHHARVRQQGETHPLSERQQHHAKVCAGVHTGHGAACGSAASALAVAVGERDRARRELCDAESALETLDILERHYSAVVVPSESGAGGAAGGRAHPKATTHSSVGVNSDAQTPVHVPMPGSAHTSNGGSGSSGEDASSWKSSRGKAIPRVLWGTLSDGVGESAGPIVVAEVGSDEDDTDVELTDGVMAGSEAGSDAAMNADTSALAAGLPQRSAARAVAASEANGWGKGGHRHAQQMTSAPRAQSRAARNVKRRSPSGKAAARPRSAKDAPSTRGKARATVSAPSAPNSSGYGMLRSMAEIFGSGTAASHSTGMSRSHRRAHLRMHDMDAMDALVERLMSQRDAASTPPPEHVHAASAATRGRNGSSTRPASANPSKPRAVWGAGAGARSATGARSTHGSRGMAGEHAAGGRPTSARSASASTRALKPSRGARGPGPGVASRAGRGRPQSARSGLSSRRA